MQKKLFRKIVFFIATKVSMNALSKATASILPYKSTGEVSTIKRLPRRNTVNPSPNSLRKNVPNWLTLSKLMKNQMDLFDYFSKHIFLKMKTIIIYK